MRLIAKRSCLLAVVLLLVAAQTTAVAHAYQHDPGKLQDRTCSACISADNVFSGCVDSGSSVDSKRLGTDYGDDSHVLLRTATPITARQRGPPVSL